MKKIKILATIALSTMVFASCGDMLNVHNPNYFTEDEMNAYLKENPDADANIIQGLTADLYTYIGLYNALINGGYSNSGAYESYKAFQRLCQTGDIIEGDRNNTGDFNKWYQNLSSNAYWETAQDTDNYGYYYASVLKVGPAQKALDYLYASKVKERPELAYCRAQALVLKALAYTELMERYTELDATTVASETAQGWPVYEKYEYANPKEPLSCKATWAWINRQFEEADSLFAVSGYGVKGYTVDASNENNLHDIDRGVCQYYRCRAALDSRDWATVISAGEQLLAMYPSFIPAASYGMPADKLAECNMRKNVSEANPYGTAWNKEYPADLNGLLNKKLNPETIFGNGASNASTQYWSVMGLNPLKRAPSGYYQMDKTLYDSMDDADCRKACVLPTKFEGLYIFTKAEKDTTWYQYPVPAYTSLKWGATCGLGQTNHDIVNTYANSSWLRSSTVLLMVAEAYAQQGNGTKAAEWLNKLLAARTLPGKTAMSCGNTADLAKVQQQWRVEMWGEGDWAFYNCKRWGKKTFTRGSNHWSTTDVAGQGWTWEIPQKERQGNPYWD